MSYKSLVVATHGLHNERTLNTAAFIAAQCSAHLSGIFVYEPIYIRFPLAYGVYLPPDLEKDRRKADERAEPARAAFDKACDSASVDARDWEFVKGETQATLASQAPRADMIIVTQAKTTRSKDSQDNDPDLPAKLAIACARPVMVVPREGEFATVGKRILIAWNGSREATRAVREALPLLCRADEVLVLAVNPESRDYRGLSEEEEPGADIALYLTRHGVNVKTAQTDSSARNVVESLLSRAADFDADLICMGAYGHSRLREVALGGVTRKIIRAMSVPLLLAH